MKILKGVSSQAQRIVFCFSLIIFFACCLFVVFRSTAKTTIAYPVIANAYGSTAENPSKARSKVYVVSAIGDSLTDYRNGGGKYLDFLRERCPESRFDNYGRGGEMVSQMRRRFSRDVVGPNKPIYTHVIVFGGVNDVYSDLTAHRTPEKIEGDLLAMYSMAREADMQVIAIAIAPWGGFRRYFNRVRSLATLDVNKWIEQQLDVGTIQYFVDAYRLLSCGVPEMLCEAFVPPYNDGLHFNALGHERLGETLYRHVFSDCR